MVWRTAIYKWVILFISLLLIGVGVFVLLDPMEFAASLIYILSIGFISLGIISMPYSLIFHMGKRPFIWRSMQGVLNIGFGILLLRYRYAAAAATSILIGGWLIFSGILKITLALSFKKYKIYNWRTNTMLGGVGIIMGCIAISMPYVGVSLLAFVVGLGLVFLGLMFLGEFLIIKYFKNS